MRKFKSLLMLFPLSLVAAALSGCGAKDEVRVLRVLNCEDYIYEYEEGDEENATEGESWYTKDVMDQFVDYWKDKTGEEIDYVYDTFDTNETMFNELQTGKTYYDVIVPSDYMIQKLISNDMLHKISEDNKENLWENISGYLRDQFDNITASYGETTYELSEFAVPYMWGTVGLMYNPAYYMQKNPDLTEDDVHALFADWDSLYTNEDIKGTYSIKDSVRDTYAVALVHAYRDEIAQTSDVKVLEEIFNRNSVDEMAVVKADMLKLKESAFGFECDSGKTDMVDQKVGANMCWSGDATWAITEARDEEHPEDNLDLYYSIPTSYNGEAAKSASNIWFDGLCMPKNTDHEDNLTDEEKAQYELAEEFIKFMSTPEIAVQNCYCVGYTPGVAGEAIFDYMLDCYETEEDDGIEYNLTYFFKDSLSDEYLADLGLTNDNIYIVTDSDMAKRELAAQYPEQEILDRLAVMRDFGSDGNARLLDMWEQVRTNALPLWGIIILVVEVLGGIAFGAYLISHKINRKKYKKIRTQN